MKLYHVAVEKEDGWFIGRILERPGVTTQGQSLDELVAMLRDAAQAMWNEPDVQLELIIGPSIDLGADKRSPRRAAG